ncbi:hypothetical protein ACFXGI_02865 [Streptomyces sp. NPDC059355]|uniref:hypothetical protein n=1 Tax=Streptomyces sp. NPDC059355 TaxID=3346811 RepID=UPI0036D0C61B
MVTNGGRAMVVLLDGEGDTREHLVDPRGEGSSGGYLLSDGQVGSYADRDTVAFDVAGRAVAYFIEHGAGGSPATGAGLGGAWSAFACGV